jgi:hypothetical protein
MPVSSAPGETVQTLPTEGMLGLHAEATHAQETVQFIEDGSLAELELPSISPINDYLLSVDDGLLNDVKGFLSRPIPIDNIVWTETQTPGTDLVSMLTVPGYSLPTDWLKVPMINEKLKGFMFIRCNFKVRVQFNAQPFNAGRLIMWFEPFGGNFDSAPSNHLSSTAHFGGITGYRHVDLDLSTSTAAELDIPYVGLISHFNLVNGSASFGKVRLTVYSQLKSGASESQTSVDGTVWVNAYDVDIQMPTGMPQHVPPTTRVVTAQSNKKEKEAPSKGTIESIASTTSKIASAVGRIPGLAEIANGVQWGADAVAGVAGMFGWSKPTDPSFTTIVQPSYVRNMTNFNGDAKSKPLGLDARNEIVVPYHSFCTDKDEMALASIIQKPVYVDRFTMDQSQAANVNLWRWPVTPTACTKVLSDGSIYPAGVIFRHTFLSYLTRLFDFWRGTLCYHFKIVKTSFHSGRVRVVYAPGATLATDPATVDFEKCYTKIYDLRDTAEFDFAIPYVFNAMWLKCDAPVSTINPSAVAYDHPTGMIYVQVLNQLRNPSIASNTIDFLVETSAGEDFQFAFLSEKENVRPLMIVHEFLGSIESDDVDRYPRKVVRAQCDDFFQTKRMQNYNANTLGMGEAITSLRQCLKRYGKFKADLPAAAAGQYNVLRVFDTNDNFESVISVSLDQTGPCDGLYNYCSYLFRMQSGSMRVMLVPNEQVAQNFSARLRPASVVPYSTTQTTYWTSIPETDWSADWTSSPLAKVLPFFEGAIEFDCPFYQVYPVQMTPVGKPDPGNAEVDPVVQPFNYGTELAVDNQVPCEVYRQIGEDFSFGYLIGPPAGLYVFPTPAPRTVCAQLDTDPTPFQTFVENECNIIIESVEQAIAQSRTASALSDNDSGYESGSEVTRLGKLDLSIVEYPFEPEQSVAEAVPTTNIVIDGFIPRALRWLIGAVEE